MKYVKNFAFGMVYGIFAIGGVLVLAIKELANL